ncbi:MAG: SDR family NAD(P)-dependent oxidoreductase [Solirubrobacteraceae bacterium]
MTTGAGRQAGRTALVTGGARGLGEGIVRRLVADGARVVIADLPRQQDLAAALAADLGDRARFHALDVTSEDAWRDGVDAVLDTYGSLDVLVNNAGVGSPSPIASTSLEHYRRIVEVNQTGTFLGMSACAPVMLRQGRGSIINIASIEGLRGLAGFAAYCGSKHAVIGMTRAVSLELASQHVRVNAVCPGPVDTPGLAGGIGGAPGVAKIAAIVPVGRLAATREVAALVAFLASDEASYCTGGDYVVDGGWTAGTT